MLRIIVTILYDKCYDEFCNRQMILINGTLTEMIVLSLFLEAIYDKKIFILSCNISKKRLNVKLKV